MDNFNLEKPINLVDTFNVPKPNNWECYWELMSAVPSISNQIKIYEDLVDDLNKATVPVPAFEKI